MEEGPGGSEELSKELPAPSGHPLELDTHQVIKQGAHKHPLIFK